VHRLDPTVPMFYYFFNTLYLYEQTRQTYFFKCIGVVELPHDGHQRHTSLFFVHCSQCFCYFF